MQNNIFYRIGWSLRRKSSTLSSVGCGPLLHQFYFRSWVRIPAQITLLSDPWYAVSHCSERQLIFSCEIFFLECLTIKKTLCSRIGLKYVQCWLNILVLLLWLVMLTKNTPNKNKETASFLNQCLVVRLESKVSSMRKKNSLDAWSLSSKPCSSLLETRMRLFQDLKLHSCI